LNERERKREKERENEKKICMQEKTQKRKNDGEMRPYITTPNNCHNLLRASNSSRQNVKYAAGHCYPSIHMREREII